MKIYKFIGERYALETLALKRLKVSKPTDTNDPFEMRPFRFASEKSRERFQKILETSETTTGFISFSGNFESPSMWANYADNHRGVCLEFDATVQSNFTRAPSRWIEKIDYVDTLEAFPDAALAPENGNLFRGWIEYAMRTKSKHWEYEEEYRKFVKYPHGADLSFFDFGGNLNLTKVIVEFRSRVSLHDVKALLTNESVWITRAKPSTSGFSMGLEKVPVV